MQSCIMLTNTTMHCNAMLWFAMLCYAMQLMLCYAEEREDEPKKPARATRRNPPRTPPRNPSSGGTAEEPELRGTSRI